MYEELKDEGFTVITVAFDKNAEEARPWIEAANPQHPSLIDTKHLVADLYNMVNVPTILWINEVGEIVRPNDVAYGDDDDDSGVVHQRARITGIEIAGEVLANLFQISRASPIVPHQRLA